MSLSITVTAGKRFTSTELVDNAKLNQMAVPTATLSGSTDTNQIGNNSVTSAKTKVGPHFFCANNGTAVNDYRVTTNAALTDGTVADGTIITFEVASATNTGASTFKADTMTARSLVKQFNVALAAGDLRLGQMVSVMWDASTTTWQMLSAAGNPDIRHASAISADGLAYSAPTSPTLTALTNGARVVVKWATANTGAVTLNLDSLGAKDVRKLNDQPLVAGDLLANQFSLLVYDTTLTHWIMLSPVPSAAVRATVPVRQTVLSGPVDSNGHPQLLSYSGQNITLAASISSPLVVAFAAGQDASGAVDYINRLTANVSNAWTLPTVNATYYLFTDRDASTAAITYGYTTTRPSYVDDDAASITSGAHTFLINEMQMYLGDGAAAATKQRVFIGEAVVSGGAITSVTSYMFRGRFKSSADQSFTLANSSKSETHKLGVLPREFLWVLVNQTAELGYVAGDEVPVEFVMDNANAINVTSAWANATTLTVRYSWSTFAPALLDASSARSPISAANWKLRAYAARGW